jgi:hypothetical protein
VKKEKQAKALAEKKAKEAERKRKIAEKKAKTAEKSRIDFFKPLFWLLLYTLHTRKKQANKQHKM